MNRVEIFKATALFNLPVTSAMSRKIKINKNCNSLKARGKTTPSFSKINFNISSPGEKLFLKFVVKIFFYDF